MTITMADTVMAIGTTTHITGITDTVMAAVTTTRIMVATEDATTIMGTGTIMSVGISAIGRSDSVFGPQTLSSI